MADLQSLTINDTGYLRLPIGTTAQRPVSPSAGYTRFNPDIYAYEYYDGTDWINIRTRLPSDLVMYYSMNVAVVTYAITTNNTTIYSLAPDGTISTVVSSTSSARGTFVSTAGYYYYGDNPVHLSSDGAQSSIIPVKFQGTTFGGYSTRYGTSTYRIHSLYETAEVEVFNNVATGINGTPTTTLTVPAGSSTTYTTSSESVWVFFNSTTPILVSVNESQPGDYMALPPASTNVYKRRASNVRTVINGTPATITPYYTGDTELCVSIGIADGSGGDAEAGIGLEKLAKNYAYGSILSDYQLVTPYASNTITVSYWNGTSWTVGETHNLSGTITSPAAEFRDGNSGFGVPGSRISGTAANLGSGANLWKFVGTQPFALIINDSVDDEEVLAGWD